MKRSIVAGALCAVVLACAAATGCSRPAEVPKPKRVGLVYIAHHELIDQIIDGFRTELTREMGNDVEIVEKHANGDAAQHGSTVAAVLGSSVDLIAPITTPIAQIALKQAPKGVPVLFLGITDPIGAGLVDSIERPVRSTGVSDMAPFEAVVSLIRTLAPSAKTVGLPYSPDEQPAVFGKDQLARFAAAAGMELRAQAVANKDELPTVIRQLAATCDVLVIGSDNAMFEAAPQIVKAGLEARKPTFAGDSTSVKAGAIGAYTINYHDVGVEGGKMAVRILRGEATTDTPVFVMKTGVLELNLKSAEQLGIRVPDNLMSQAKTIIK
jgi:putative tryptophan/tyrosine transport system substrate-binding protein